MITCQEAQAVLQAALSYGGDFAEIFQEETFSSSYSLLNTTVEKAGSAIRSGLGLRIYQGLSSVYSTTNDFDLSSLIKMASELSKSVASDRKVECKPLKETMLENKHPILKMPNTVSAQEKIAVLKKAAQTALDEDEVIRKVMAVHKDEQQHVVIANSEGRYVQDTRVHTRFALTAIAMDNELMQDASEAPGSGCGFELYDNIDVEAIARKVAQTAKVMLTAEECPSGVMDVVLDNGFGGVIFHEACGHGLEATSVAKNQSIFAGKIGQKVASDCVNAVDDGTIVNGWGSANVDDEGNPMQRNVLIENGILKGYMIDTLNGRRMNHASTGSARRQDYRYEPTSRMTNTFLLNGTHRFEELIEATSFGLYAKSLGGGSVDPQTGDFNFAVNEGYLIRDGKIAEPVKGATLVGNGGEVLMHIDMVADNLKRAQGICGSISGSIPADVGQPSIRVLKMSVGGRGGTLS